ncbi:hypothetical protein D9619_009381 [Psilocybe cf. subviscida]|uniref:Endonuclease/exonuclease/phosphatase domain-containing protein n=1 Tax=Psilocybe cf. subviscida TaxID=2480587 RepID=A0A8H5BUL1_9AGAR|nr:hypothetical protein D9619_009381 [Psilocybe cf. subviscida]
MPIRSHITKSETLFVATDEDEGGRKLGLDNVFRTELPCRYQRDALCVDIVSPAAPGAEFRLLNIHLDSSDSRYKRYLQMRHLAGLLSEPRSSGGIIAGDCNTMLPEGHGFVDKRRHLDGWVTLQETTGLSRWIRRPRMKIDFAMPTDGVLVSLEGNQHGNVTEDEIISV